MSVLFQGVYADAGDSFFVLNNNDTAFLSSINVYNGTINTSQINLDAIRMDCAVINGNPTLLLNNQPVAGISSLTSSVTSWASYPALNTITYSGLGGTADLANVNALTNLSSLTGTLGALTVSSINGNQFPATAGQAVLATSDVITNGIHLTKNFTGLPNGYYMVTVLIQTGGADPLSCATIISYQAGITTGGSLHCPVMTPNGSAPSFSNCVSIQSDVASNPIIDIYIFTNTQVGATVQSYVTRIT
jgi:hypothetical protein